MESNFDLDVNNYSIDDLLGFFKLKDNYNENDVERKVDEMSKEILGSLSSSHNQKYKFDIMNFIKLAKDILISSYYEIQTKIEMEKRNNKKTDANNIGKIINPLAVHPALQRQSIPSNNINGYDHNNSIALYVFNTATRENFFGSVSTNCTFILPTKLKNVISISLSSAQIPNVMFAFSSERGTNQLYIFEDNTNLNGVVTIPDGNYVRTQNTISVTLAAFAEIAPTLEKAINEQILGIFDTTLYRFKVTISPATSFVTITNTTNTFSMNTLKRDLTDASFCDPYSFPRPNLDNLDPKLNVKPSQYIDTLGYLLGYREISYSGLKSYTSEGTFSNDYSTYLYFALNDYTGSQKITSTYGILQNSLIDNDILALIPLNGLPFNFVYDNDSNFIYKRREYFGPVDISRITIKLLNQTGNVVNLLNNNFSFTLKVTTIYDISKPFSRDLFEII
jgi:hypothetical protein